MVIAHYIPFRAIRAGHQLSDSKGASAAISSEVCLVNIYIINPFWIRKFKKILTGSNIGGE